jgi:hypothetical protein
MYLWIGNSKRILVCLNFSQNVCIPTRCYFENCSVFVFIEHILTLVPVDDGLKHRPQAEWSIMYMNCELNDAEIWLKSALQEEPGKEVLMLFSVLFIPSKFSRNFSCV